MQDNSNKLEKQLQHLLSEDPANIPNDIDTRILAMADEKARQIRTANIPARKRYFYRYTAAAAAILVLCGIILVPRRKPETITSLDIVDAYMLASAIESGNAPGPEYDLNNDGTVNHLDVNEMARRAVSLSGPNREES